MSGGGDSEMGRRSGEASRSLAERAGAGAKAYFANGFPMANRRMRILNSDIILPVRRVYNYSLEQ